MLEKIKNNPGIERVIAAVLISVIGVVICSIVYSVRFNKQHNNNTDYDKDKTIYEQEVNNEEESDNTDIEREPKKATTNDFTDKVIEAYTKEAEENIKTYYTNNNNLDFELEDTFFAKEEDGNIVKRVIFIYKVTYDSDGEEKCEYCPLCSYEIVDVSSLKETAVYNPSNSTYSDEQEAIQSVEKNNEFSTYILDRV